MTASVMYNRPVPRGNWATTLVWGRNRSLDTGLVWNGYLAESTLRFIERNYVWGRIENELAFTVMGYKVGDRRGSRLEPRATAIELQMQRGDCLTSSCFVCQLFDRP
jgi:hypothetical protein